MFATYIWASSRENLSSMVCKQQRHRPACPSAQSDQRLWVFCILESIISKSATSTNFNFLASPCNWGDWFEAPLVVNPKDRSCRDEAHIIQDNRLEFPNYNVFMSLKIANMLAKNAEPEELPKCVTSNLGLQCLQIYQFMGFEYREAWCTLGEGKWIDSKYHFVLCTQVRIIIVS